LHEVFGDERKDFFEWNALYARILKSRTEAIVKRLIDKVSRDVKSFVCNYTLLSAYPLLPPPIFRTLASLVQPLLLPLLHPLPLACLINALSISLLFSFHLQNILSYLFSHYTSRQSSHISTPVYSPPFTHQIKKNPLKFMNIKQMVVADLVADKRLIVELFQRCGRDELKFIVTTGLWGGTNVTCRVYVFDYKFLIIFMMKVMMSVLHLILIFHQKIRENDGKERNKKEQYGM
jgi:hypothetical protein